MIDNDVHDLSGGDIVELSPLKELSHDLIAESIKTQVRNPFFSRIDFLEQFAEGYDDNTEELDIDSDEFIEYRDVALDFYLEVLHLVNDRFGLEIDFDIVESYNLDALRTLAEGVYTFFILKYRKNAMKYLTYYILDNADALADAYKDDNMENVSLRGWVRKIDTVEHAIVITHAITIARNFDGADIDTSEFMEAFNQDKYEVAVVSDAIQDNVIQGEFIETFFENLYDSDMQTDEFESIAGAVQNKLYKKWKNSAKIEIDFLEPEEEEVEEEA